MNKAKSTDPKKIAAALEGMKFEVFNGGEGFMRKDDHQFFQPMYISSFGERAANEPFDEENTGWGWQTVGKIDAKDTMLPTTCKMNAAELTKLAEPRRRRRAPAAVSSLHRGRRAAWLELFIISTLNGVLYGMLLFMLASGLTLIFSMMGVLNFAHASFYMLGAYFGFQISRWVGFWPALVLAPLLVGVIGALVERFGLAQRAQVRPRGRAAFTFGLAFMIEELVQMIWGKSPGRFPRAGSCSTFPAFTLFATNYPAYSCSCC